MKGLLSKKVEFLSWRERIELGEVPTELTPEAIAELLTGENWNAQVTNKPYAYREAIVAACRAGEITHRKSNSGHLWIEREEFGRYCDSVGEERPGFWFQNPPVLPPIVEQKARAEPRIDSTSWVQLPSRESIAISDIARTVSDIANSKSKASNSQKVRWAEGEIECLRAAIYCLVKRQTCETNKHKGSRITAKDLATKVEQLAASEKRQLPVEHATLCKYFRDALREPEE